MIVETIIDYHQLSLPFERGLKLLLVSLYLLSLMPEQNAAANIGAYANNNNNNIDLVLLSQRLLVLFLMKMTTPTVMCCE